MRRGRWLWAGVALIAAVIVVALALNGLTGRTAATPLATSPVSRGAVVATVNGSGTVAAARELNLAFEASGTVAEVLVAEGDTVREGQALARLDPADLELQVASAQAALDSARTKLAQVTEGDVQQADITAQQAVEASARAQLASAQAQLEALKSPSASVIGDAESAVRQAEIDLQTKRDNGSAAKTRSQQDLQRAVDSLTQAQSRYATAKAQWEYAAGTGNDPINPSSTGADGRKVDNELSDGQRQQYYDSYVQAEAALRSAETAVQQAQVSYDNARQQEVAGVQQAEAKLADALRQLDALRNPTSTDVAQRQATVDQARASLTQAQANLDKLTAPGTASDVAIQQAAVTQAEQSLKQARLKLEQATLTAPFDGVVTAVEIVPGSSAASATPAVSLLDRDPLHVDLKLSENDVAKVALGQPVTLTIDALKGWTATGSVSYIASAAESSNGVVTYAVRVSFPDDDERVRVGMTANLTITTDEADGVLLVPSTALLPQGAGHAVQVVDPDGAAREVAVEIGLTDGRVAEITGGLSEGDQVVTSPSATTAPQGRGGLPLLGR